MKGLCLYLVLLVEIILIVNDLEKEMEYFICISADCLGCAIGTQHLPNECITSDYDDNLEQLLFREAPGDSFNHGPALPTYVTVNVDWT